MAWSWCILGNGCCCHGEGSEFIMAADLSSAYSYDAVALLIKIELLSKNRAFQKDVEPPLAGLLRGVWALPRNWPAETLRMWFQDGNERTQTERTWGIVWPQPDPKTWLRLISNTCSDEGAIESEPLWLGPSLSALCADFNQPALQVYFQQFFKTAPQWTQLIAVWKSFPEWDST